MNNSLTIDLLSCVSILVEPLIQHLGSEEIRCGPATAFVVQLNKRYFLVTNYHVVSGRRSTDNAPLSSRCGLPTHLRCYFHGQNLGTWTQKVFRLYSGDGDPSADKPIWSAAHLQGSTFLFADVVILPLMECDDVKLYPVTMTDGVPIATCPCSRATVIGFPGARTSYKFFPIWVTGYVASEPQLDYDNAPVVLINATTTGGMSGSPVFQIEDGSYIDDQGGMHIEGKRVWKFLGIYSGRITEANLNLLAEDSCLEDNSPLKSNILNIGLVWKPLVINKLIENILSNDRV